MDFLNFEEIHKAMTSLDWYWHHVDGIPEVYQIRRFVRELLHEFIDCGLKELQCGGFRIWKSENSIRISFEITNLEIDLNENLE